jgi:hypothetical protein
MVLGEFPPSTIIKRLCLPAGVDRAGLDAFEDAVDI